MNAVKKIQLKNIIAIRARVLYRTHIDTTYSVFMLYSFILITSLRMKCLLLVLRAKITK